MNKASTCDNPKGNTKNSIFANPFNMTFKYFISLFVFLVMISSLYCSQSELIKDENTLKILTPSLKDVKTLKIRLSNGLEAYLVSDPAITKSGAGIAINTGSWQNPKEYPGLAHFLEHMLFLGTAKYPNESDYMGFLDDHGGMHNAYTAGDRTVYMFSVNNDSFVPALDRFAQFFISPLFNPSGVSREVKAIDQEYAKNIQDDPWRIIYVNKAQANQEHPDSQFDIGNLKTISKIPPQSLREWFNTHYSANLMHLILFSPLPLEDLQAIVEEDFGPIENKNINPYLPSMPVKSPKSVGDIVWIEPYQDIKHLILQWEMPASLQYDADAVAFILGNEDKNSLIQLLKNKGLAESIGVGKRLYKPSMIFNIDIALTESGIKDINQVIEHVFEAIALLKEKGVPKSIFDEMTQVAINQYEYQSRGDVFNLVMSLADSMVDESLQTFPKKTYIGDIYNPEKIKEVINYLKATNCYFIVVAKENLSGQKPNKKEPWLGASYSVEKLQDSFLKNLDKLPPNPSIKLPLQNPFIAEHLTLLNQNQEDTKLLVPTPAVIFDDAQGIVYYAQDNRYLVPEVSMSFRIHTGLSKPGNSIQQVTTDLYLYCLNEQLNEILYQAQMANLNCTITSIESGLNLQISGFSEKSKLFLSKVLNEMTNLNIDEQIFKTQKESLTNSYQNAALDTPISQGIELMRAILNKNFVTNEKRAQAIKNVTKESLNRFANNLFNKTYIEGVIYGNITSDEASQMVAILQKSLNSKPLPEKEIPKKMVLKLNNELGPFSILKKIEQPGNANFLLIENGCYSIKKRCLLQILSRGIQEPFFSELRTKQQTGYIVASDDQDVERELIQFFIVQSNTHDPSDLNSRFELFIENILRDLETSTFTIDRFETIKNSLIDELSKPMNNLKEMANVLDSLAFDFDGDFDFINKRIKSTQDASYDEFVSFAKDFLGRENKRRLSIQIQGSLPKSNELHYTQVPSIQRLRSLGEFLSKNENICNNEE